MSTQLTKPKTLTIRSSYGPKARIRLTCKGPGRTKQSFKDECDINKIMARFVRTGVLDFVSKYSPQYGDVTGADFAEAMNIVAQSRSMFAALPASIRSRFDNSPEKFLSFMEDPANAAKARELGLLPPEAPEQAPEPQAPVAAPAPATAA